MGKLNPLILRSGMFTVENGKLKTQFFLHGGDTEAAMLVCILARRMTVFSAFQVDKFRLEEIKHFIHIRRRRRYAVIKEAILQ